MFNKYRNIKKIGLVLIGLALVIFLITNVRIRSVDSYRKQFSNMADSGQTQPAKCRKRSRKPDNVPPQDKREAGAFNPAGLPTAGGLFGEQGYVSVDRNYLALLDSKENFSRWSQFLRYHLNVKTYDEYKG